MAGIGRAAVRVGLVAAVLPLVLGGGTALALDRPAPARPGTPCVFHHRSYAAYPWQIERLVRLLADGVEARRKCFLLRHRHRHGERPGCLRRTGRPMRAREGAGRLPGTRGGDRRACDRPCGRGRTPRG